MKKMNFFNSEKIIRLTPLTTDSVEVANEIIAKNVKVFPKLKNVLVDNLSDLWEMSFSSSPSTYCLYIYALYPVSYLLNAFEKTGEEKYLVYAKDLVLNFISWESKEKSISAKKLKILYGDHAVSNRTQAMCYLVCCLRYRDEEVPTPIISALLDNGNYLADDKNYSHYNHGLMMDLALVGLLNVFKGIDCNYPHSIEDKLSSRLKKSLVRDLTDDGIHIENSPGYHFWMLGFLERISPSLKPFDRELYETGKEGLIKAREYGKYLTRSDGSVPAIGDTHSGVRYLTDNERGSKFFSDSNQVIFKGLSSKVWAFFSSGYKTHIHKHEDNGVFNLFYDGHDVLIDPGFLNYESDEDSSLIKSAVSHNVPRPITERSQKIINFDVVNQSATKENLSDSRIVFFHENDYAEVALSVIDDYETEEILRLVFFIKSGDFLIFDFAVNGSGIESGYNIALDAKIEKVTNGSIKIALSNGNSVHINNLLNENSSTGIDEVIVAKSFGEKIKGRRLTLKSGSDYIVTHIQLGEETFSTETVKSFSKNILAELREKGLHVNADDLLNESADLRPIFNETIL